MQDILPPSRGRIRPTARTTPRRTPSSPARRPTAPLPTPAPIATPKPSPANPNPAEHYHAPRAKQPPAPVTTPDPHSRHLHSRSLARTAYKLHLVHRLNEHQQQPPKVPLTTAVHKHAVVQAFKRLRGRSALTGAAVVLILVITGFVSFDTWQTNNLAKQALAKNTITAASSSLSSTDRQSSEGKDESPLPENALTNYRVAPNLPRAVYINKLDVAARVLPMGVNDDGSMQAPLGIYDAGWYSGSVRPGETGAMILNGHSSGPTRQGLLGRLDTLKQGDEIVIEKGDASRLTYRVEHTETVPLEAVDMNKVALPYGTAKSGLNIYTCTGEWLPTKQTFDHRVIVYAVEV